MRSTLPFFPVQFRSHALTTDQPPTQIENEVEGGVSIREMFALEIYCAFASNPALVGVRGEQLRAQAIKVADQFVGELSATPDPNDLRN